MHTLDKQIHSTIVTCFALLSMLVTFAFLIEKDQPQKIAHQSAFPYASFERGKQLFGADCSICHSLSRQACPDLLENVVGRLGHSYLAAYICNQDSLLQTGDHYALQMREKMQTRGKHRYSYTARQINDLIHYIQYAKTALP